MNKDQVKDVKEFVDSITGKQYVKTFSSKSETLHIRIATYLDRNMSDKEWGKWIESMETERNTVLCQLQKFFPQYHIEKNNKRYQGFINDLCITIR